MKKYNYTYLLEFNDGMKYVGVHSTNIKPELDACYLGSGRLLPPRTMHTVKKTILNTFSTREEAVEAETWYIYKNGCVESKAWYNLRYSNYDKSGSTCSSGKKLLGRTAKDFEYIAEANRKRAKYVGDNRTPAQKDWNRRQRGRKCPWITNEHNRGVSNPMFRPWYCIRPQSTIVEELTEITQLAFAKELKVTRKVLQHRLTEQNRDKPAKQGGLKGYQFGYL